MMRPAQTYPSFHSKHGSSQTSRMSFQESLELRLGKSPSLLKALLRGDIKQSEGHIVANDATTGARPCVHHHHHGNNGRNNHKHNNNHNHISSNNNSNSNHNHHNSIFR